MSRRMKKVKVTKDSKILMIYEQMNDNGCNWDEYQFTCSDLAKPSFYTAIEKLSPYVIEMCELPDDYLDRIKVRGVSFSYSGDNDVMGATITASMKLDLSNCPLNLNTPHKAADSYIEDMPADEKALLSAACIKDLERLMDECQSYIDGDRAQQRLFTETTDQAVSQPLVN